MSKPVVAAQMYTCREFCKTPAQITESLKRVADIGYTAIQASGMGSEEEMEPQDMREVCDDLGLNICATHISFEEMRDEPERVVEEHNILGAEYAGIGGAPQYAHESEQTWVDFAKEASEVAERLAEDDITFIYHNHSQEYAKFGDRTVMEILFEESDPDYFMFEPDTYWVQHGGASPVAWLEKLSGRCPVVHLKDMGITFEREQFYTEIGEGNLDWPGIMQACEDAGVEWMPVEQDVTPGDPFESLRISYENLSSWGYK